ncbi:MAG TPA: DUF4426 domain-containing protein [Oleiagrimonas sp.]|nr:DUF4426 domain-containing protein [Oleiagrimonas sp.]
MRRLPALATLLTCLLWLGLPGGALAYPGTVQSGQYTIHYNALSGDALPLASTRAYGLRHASDQGLVVIAVNKGDPDTGTNVPFGVSGHAATLLGKPVPLTFRHVDDGHDHHSVLVVFTVSSGETLRFDLDVTPQDAGTTHLHFVHSYEP